MWGGDFRGSTWHRGGGWCMARWNAAQGSAALGSVARVKGVNTNIREILLLQYGYILLV